MRIVALIVCLSCSGAAAAEQRPAIDPAEAEIFAQQVQPLFRKYCISCHSGADPQAGLELDKYSDVQTAVADRPTWDKILEYLAGRVMPPEDEPQPSDAEIEQVTAWIEATFSKLDCSIQREPGRVTIRRLNRAEYNNTIRDLVGVDFRPANDFPSDDVGYGFDNIGDVLSLPPLLLEKYMTAAEQIAAQAIVVPDPARIPSQRFEAEQAAASGNGGEVDQYRGLYSDGEVYVHYDLPRDGKYLIRARAFGDQAGDEPARMSLRLNDRNLRTVDVKAEEDEPGVYEAEVDAQAGRRKIAAAFVNDFYRPGQNGQDKQDRNLFVDYLEIVGPLDGEGDTLPESHRRILIRYPGEGIGAEEAARQIIERFATRAYRRPAGADEVERLVRFVRMAQQDGASFERGVQLAVQAVLVSPHFLFRVELDDGRGQDGGELNDFELAARLSYFLWSSMPDDELFSLAEKGVLRQDGNLERQARRMLADAKARALVDNFAGQWLQLRSLKLMTPDPKQFPAFDEPLRAAMRTETEMFFEAILFEDRSVLEFLDSDFTFLNERLAEHYGINGVSGDHFRRVALRGDQRGGVLTQASVLTITSNPTRTSPVKRGKWVLENLLGSPPPPPPAGVEELKEGEDVELLGSLRQRMEQHRANASCASCHSRMDPLGFGLENYNAVGAWRTQDGKFPIDASGDLPGGRKFNGPRELKGILKGQSKQFARCLTEKMLTYALGRGLEISDRCEVDRIAGKLAEGQFKFSRLVTEIVASDSFQMRRTPGGEE